MSLLPGRIIGFEDCLDCFVRMIETFFFVAFSLYHQTQLFHSHHCDHQNLQSLPLLKTHRSVLASKHPPPGSFARLTLIDLSQLFSVL